jgi:glutamate/aspartate transport system substrate-binding protein
LVHEDRGAGEDQEQKDRDDDPAFNRSRRPDVLLAGFIAANKTQSSMAVVGDFLTYEPYGIMFRKDDPQMRKAVDRAFATMAQTGALVATYHKWFLQPTPTGELLDLPLSLQLTEGFRALGVDDF